MPKFSARSKRHLATCHKDLQRLFNEIVKHFDCAILEGYRGQEIQDKLYEEGATKLLWPESRHNKMPSQAIDVAPYPIDWDNVDRFKFFAGYVLGWAEAFKIPLRWGGDWNQNMIMSDQDFNDLVHFELVDPED